MSNTNNRCCSTSVTEKLCQKLRGPTFLVWQFSSFCGRIRKTGRYQQPIPCPVCDAGSGQDCE
jgi:hypothetical protein